MKKIGSLISLFVAMSACALAQSVDLSIALDKSSVLLGDTIRLTITVRGDDHPETPQIPEIPGFDHVFSGTRQESFRSYTVVVQGKTVKNEKTGGGYHFDYQLSPKESGTFQIPSLTIRYKGESYPTQPFQIEVLDQHEQSDDIFLKVHSTQNELYLGESTEITFEWYFSQNIQNYSLRVPWLEGLKGFLISDPEPESRRAQYFQINDGQKVIAEKNQEIHKGKQYTVVRFKKILTPIAAGVYTLDAPFLKCDVISGYQKNQTRSVFDDFFDTGFSSHFGRGTRAITREFATRGDALTLTVKDLPDSGVSDNFGGAVGKFEFYLRANPSKLKVGEPVTLQMIVVGQGNLESIKSPSLNIGPEFKSYESESKIVKDEKSDRRMKVFERVLVPRQAGEHELSAVAFEYFDTDKKQYVTVESKPVLITVEPAGASDVTPYKPGQAKGSATQFPAQDPTVLKEDIRFIKHSYNLSESSSVFLWVNRFLLWLSLLIPLLTCGWICRKQLQNKQDGNPALKRRLRAYKNFKSHMERINSGVDNLSDREFGENLLKSVNEYLSDALNLSPGTTVYEALNSLQEKMGMNNDLEELRSACESCESAMYASKSLSLQVRKALVASVERGVKHAEGRP